MSDAKRYEGSCHCGKVKYNVTTDLKAVMECNCSHCSRKGFLLAFVEPPAFELVAGSDGELTEYLFNRQSIHHVFCPTCGVQSYAKGTKRDGSPMVMINVRCLDGVDVKALEIKQVDGKSF